MSRGETSDGALKAAAGQKERSFDLAAASRRRTCGLEVRAATVPRPVSGDEMRTKTSLLEVAKQSPPQPVGLAAREDEDIPPTLLLDVLPTSIKFRRQAES